MKVIVIEKKTYHLDEYKPCLGDIIIDLENLDTWIIQLTIAINFISSKDAKEGSVIHSKSDSKWFMLYDNANKVVDEIFTIFLSRYFFQDIKPI